MLELVDEADSKSVGLITRAGSTPATGTIFAPKCHASELFLQPRSKDLNIFWKRRKNCICRRNLAGEIQMRVDIGCGADVTMPQPFLNFFQAHTIGIQQAGTAMSFRTPSYRQSHAWEAPPVHSYPAPSQDLLPCNVS